MPSPLSFSLPSSVTDSPSPFPPLRRDLIRRRVSFPLRQALMLIQKFHISTSLSLSQLHLRPPPPNQIFFLKTVQFPPFKSKIETQRYHLSHQDANDHCHHHRSDKVSCATTNPGMSWCSPLRWRCATARREGSACTEFRRCSAQSLPPSSSTVTCNREQPETWTNPLNSSKILK